MDKYFDKSCASKPKVTSNKGIKRKYKEDYIKYVLIAYGSADNKQPLCIICGMTLSKETLVLSRRLYSRNHLSLKTL